MSKINKNYTNTFT